MPDNDAEIAHNASVEDIPAITRGIQIVGDIKGVRDLSIDGKVTGSIFLPENRVWVGDSADVHANISARIIEVAGKVVGDLMAADHVVIRSSSTVEGDIVAPQIQLEEGCQFKGAVQMRKPDMSRQPPTKPRVTGDPGAVRFKSANG